MARLDALAASYVEHVAQLERRLTTDDALRRAVGGEFIAVGKLEYHLLRSRGLRDDQTVVDVGCGSGRLACQLAPFPGIRYVGTDVVPRLLEYARDLCARPDWQFVHTNGATIPCGDNEADFVCFFSVFTHLPQEDIYRYFREAARVLNPGGVLLMSFLEFRVPAHWAAFIASVDGTREDQHLNQFIDREAIQAWAAPTGLAVRTIHAGDSNYIPLPEEVRYENGARVTDAASLGQSLAVLQKSERSMLDPPSRETNGIATEATPALALREATDCIRFGRDGAPLKNVSARGYVSAADSLSVGFIIGGDCPRTLLVRGVGPTLRMFGVPNPIARPVVELRSGDVRCGGSSGPWGGAAELIAAAEAVGAFPLSAGSNDVALRLTLAPGSYTANLVGAAADEGQALLEVYLVS